MPRDRTLVYGLTFTVALCSIVYELIYSEMLTVVFGGRAVRYAITIGLFLFFLGLGAFAFDDLGDARENFFRVEGYLAVAGPAGLLYLVYLNAVPVGDVEIPRNVSLVLSHLPVVVVGFLSGLEIPLLTALLEEVGEDEPLAPMARRGVDGARRVLRSLLAGPFVVDDGTSGDPDAFSAVLGMDYLGSLVGTVAYALWLFPELGLFPSVFVLGMLNAVAALAFAARFGDRRTVLGDSVSVRVGGGSAVLTAAVLVLAAVYGGVVLDGERVESAMTETYLEASIENEYPGQQMDVEVTEHFTTRYQEVTRYRRTWTGDRRDWAGPGQTETCLRLDGQLQLCENWVRPYHRGLVDVPASLFEDFGDKKVLLVGGGDFVAVDHLREYGVTVDQVDIDREFMAYARNSSFLSRYHQGAYRYENLTTIVDDAFSYLQETDERYDLILLDVPGIRNDELLSLYSVEFYELLADHLSDDGLVVTWAYSRTQFAEHHHVYMNTVEEAGFERYASYRTYGDLNGDGDDEPVERYYVLATGESAERSLPSDADRELTWRPIPRYRGVEPNSIFHPNYDIIVDFR
ncbi:spermidine synthase [Halobacteriales archaeon QS_1_68_20]|nr:MAG: spermidine synthase [Halobacteriales archaeon QS_1_68_20]